MFGKSKLLSDGVQAQAIVVDANQGGLSNSHGEYRWKLTLRVQYADGTSADLSVHAYEVGPMHGYGIGDIVPVRYDEKHRDKVEVDVPTIKEQRAANLAAGRAGMIAAAEERLRNQAPGAGS